MKYEVGQKVFVVPSKRIGKPEYEEITKVGRKWVHLKYDRRFEIGSDRLDGGEYSSPGSVYASEKEYLEQKFKQESWEKLCLFFRHKYSCPKEISLDDIRKINEIMKVTR